MERQVKIQKGQKNESGEVAKKLFGESEKNLVLLLSLVLLGLG